MQKKDYAILSALRQDARMGLTKMSRMTRVPVSTIHDKLKSYSGSVVLRNTALLDFGRLGYSTRVNLMLRVSPKDKDALQHSLSVSVNVNSLFRINNGFDFLVDCVFKDMKEVEDFMDSIEKKHDIKAKQVYFVIEDICRESFLSNPDIAECYSSQNL